MLILSIESSAKPASVAVYRHGDDGVCDGGGASDGGASGGASGGNHDGNFTSNSGGKFTSNSGGGVLLGQYFQNNGFSHSRTLMAMTEALLCGLDLKPSDIELFAVANGPGSFTGVRIGVSAIKGLALGLDTPVCGVSTLEAMAYQAKGTNALICPVMDARRGQVYNALFCWENDRLIRLREDRAISISDLTADLRGFCVKENQSDNADNENGDKIYETFIPLGDGTDLLLSELKDDSSLPLLTPNPLIKYQTAYGVALAALHNKTVRAAELEPMYLRPSQAERNRLSQATPQNSSQTL